MPEKRCSNAAVSWWKTPPSSSSAAASWSRADPQLNVLALCTRSQPDTGRCGSFAHSIFHLDRKSTRLNSSHLVISYAVFCLKKKSTNNIIRGILSTYTPAQGGLCSVVWMRDCSNNDQWSPVDISIVLVIFFFSFFHKPPAPHLPPPPPPPPPSPH